MTDGMWVDRATLDAWKKEKDDLVAYAMKADERIAALTTEPAAKARDAAMARCEREEAERKEANKRVVRLQEALATTVKEKDALRGAMDAQDERERLAGEACGVPWTMHGCDWPDAVAEEVKVLRRERDASRSILRAQDEDICAILRDRDALREQLATAMMERDALRADLIKAVQHGMAAIMHAERVRAEAVPLDPADRHPCGAWYCKGGCDGCAECQMDHGSAR